jgi:hypothetical protein
MLALFLSFPATRFYNIGISLKKLYRFFVLSGFFTTRKVQKLIYFNFSEKKEKKENGTKENFWSREKEPQKRGLENFCSNQIKEAK